MNLDVVSLTRSHPKATMFVRRVRSVLSGRPYFFNRQKMRAEVFRRIDDRIAFDNYIETGTFLGMTTHFFSSAASKRGAQVHTCEISEDFYAIADRTVGHLSNVRRHLGNSVDFLKRLAPDVAKANNFVYLDAHWYDYLPLRDELSILKDWHNTIVLIDDFQVPTNPDFGWDRYDEEREICLSHIAGSYGNNPVYFPNYPTEKEGGGPARGYCVIPMSGAFATVLDGIDLLQPTQP